MRLKEEKRIQLHRAWAKHWPSSKGLILLVGEEALADARVFQQLGQETIVATTTDAVLEGGLSSELGRFDVAKKLMHQSLELVLEQDWLYDAIILCDVWTHLPETKKARLFRKLCERLKPGGNIVVLLPRPMGEGADVESHLHELQSLAKRRALVDNLPITQRLHLDQSRVTTWDCRVFTLADDGTGALPLLRHIIVNDNKSSTYKLALLRVLLRIADGARGAVIGSNSDYVDLPFGLVALYWAKMFKPLVLDNDFPQLPNGNGKLSFCRDAFLALNAVSIYDLAFGRTFSGRTALSLFEALRDIRNTIKKMPGYYITLPNSDEQVFKMELGRLKKHDTITIDLEFLKAFGKFSVPRHLWNAMCRYACWLEPAIIREWTELMIGFSKTKNISYDECFRALKWLDAERNTTFVQKRVNELFTSGKELHCIWSGKRLNDNVHIDHCIPYSVWPNNDLWNLFPSRKAVNLKKRDRLPSAEALRKAKDRIIEWYHIAYDEDDYLRQFETEANTALPAIRFHEDVVTRDCDFHDHIDLFIDVFERIDRQRIRLKVDQQIKEWDIHSR